MKELRLKDHMYVYIYTYIFMYIYISWILGLKSLIIGYLDPLGLCVYQNPEAEHRGNRDMNLIHTLTAVETQVLGSALEIQSPK